ncbi:MAG: aminotransferase DegT [Nitrospirales bacterium]|nr:MAG: aminotransferase DegT [Nitrospirales bacterium]
MTAVRIPHSKPQLGCAELAALTEVIESKQISQGPRIAAFEHAMADYVGVAGGVAVSSGTVALYLALQALGVQEDDEVIMPSYVCAAPWVAAIRLGATPIIVDIEPGTFAIDPEAVKTAITTRTRAIVVPHLFGLPADLKRLRTFGVPLVEDCAQTLGASQANVRVGTVGDVSVCSFFATKLLCAGEGGMVLSNDDAVLEKIRGFREFDERPQLSMDCFNFKMTDLQASLGMCQLTKLDSALVRRAVIANRYATELGCLPVSLPHIPQDRTHIYYRYVLSVSQPLDDLLGRLHNRGLQCRRPIYKPLHSYVNLQGRYPVSEQAFVSSLSLPIYPSLTDKEVDWIIKVLLEELN